MLDLEQPTSSSFRSRTFYRRLLFPIVTALIVITAAEATLGAYLRPTFWDKTSWLLHDPYRGEGFDRVNVVEKLNNLLKVNPDIISVGDSSGFFSLQPTIINRYTNGKTLVNLSTGANQATDGYRAIAEFSLQQAPSIKYVVLHMFPQLVPGAEVLRQGGQSPLLRENLISFRRDIMPPSTALAPYAKMGLFEGRSFDPDQPLLNHKVYLEFRATVGQTLGWVPEHDVRYDRLFGRVAFYSDERIDLLGKLPGSEPSSIVHALDVFAKTVESYGATLIIAFSPIAERHIVYKDPYLIQTEKALERFQREHPNVVFLFPLITTFSSEKFAQFNHSAREYSFIPSKRLGMALGGYFRDPASVPKFTARYVEKPPGPLPVVRATDGSDDALRDTAMSYYMYTATTDPKYRAQISKRVLDLLDREEAFGFMMDDTRSKLELLSRSGAQLGYSMKDLKGFPVELTNMSYCNAGDPTLQWAQVMGTMSYSYTDRFYNTTEPVVWPEKSNLLIPTILEDGVRKFDGYCPEPSMDQD